MRYLNENTVVLCRRGSSCCPVVEADINTGEFRITDDYGGEVRLTNEEAQMLGEFLKTRASEGDNKE